MSCRQRGLTLLEFALVVVFVGLLMWLAMTKILRLEGDVERVNVQRTVAALNSALAMEFAERVVESRLDTVPELASGNPMERLAQVPHNYLGPIEHAAPAEIRLGHWYYDMEEAVLVYRISHADRFETPLEGPPRARFRVEVVTNERDGSPQGVRVVAVDAFEWK
ncbi:prepilin-type N-terminal cleavage/methylation domain-containing protein [Thioalkalivibrio denitrificans]|uniref:Prepilin-type N-terminal cleavage/methylation domain-containing protein n=1 Tax=Thioalkalivibrio denitrificans TaxID=108003 RepID=A0A1V3NPV8_9GAMM|nr:prepilin-type cleavage/methylation domain-containing protein [Thioalkalivibrio denitrificans]OOG26786.1 prepilin-type N-terminal cleavage/methylation domain-containing protein [Thioalkalivibrio denitrificans]